MMCRIAAADSRLVTIHEEERKKREIDKKRNETHTGNIIRSCKELSLLHYLRKDNRATLPFVSNAQFTNCKHFYKQVNCLELYTRLYEIEIIYINMQFIFLFLEGFMYLRILFFGKLMTVFNQKRMHECSFLRKEKLQVQINM